MNVPTVELFSGELDDFANASGQEWLVTNGVGGFACGTVSGARTRRYHGLLVAALNPPQERTLVVANVEVTARYAGTTYALATNEFHDHTVHPTGYAFIERFRLEGLVPVWRFVLGDAVIEQTVWMAHGVNTTHLRLDVVRASAPVTFELAPLCTHRDYHQHNRGAQPHRVEPIAGGFTLTAFDGARPYHVTVDQGDYRDEPVWYWGFRHRLETRRGLDDLEDLFRPGFFTATIEPGAAVTVTATTEAQTAAPELSLAGQRSRERELLAATADEAPDWIRQLTLATDQFIVERSTDSAPGRTVIAGYPWFGDWGRDTMIALPGLTLATGRFDAAADILRTFARHVDQGMLPNRFPDAGSTPEYNTVDATLWYFHALDRYLRHSGDRAILADLYPVLVDIVDWHVRGTRYGIAVDPADGLLRAGEPGVQLTWMDARVGDRVVTPRIGKPVEINALWYAALVTAQSIAEEVGDPMRARYFQTMAARVVAGFQRRYWSEQRGYLNDVVDGPDCRPDENGNLVDPSLRPNQILAIAVAPDLLDRRVVQRVVDRCARALWTPVGLRSLDPAHPDYVGRYGGGPWERDAAYHQGTVWSWLLGPFALAHFHAYGDAAAARQWLEGIRGHLRDACAGQVSEIFDGDPPHRPEGCFAQAWGVAEILWAWIEIGSAQAGAATEMKS